MSTATITTDEAMAKRTWSPSDAPYTNDTVVGFSNLSPLESAGDSNWNYVVDTGTFMGNACYMPVGFFSEPDWQMVQYKSLSTPATYTAMPPLPPAANASPARSGVPATQPSGY